MLKNRDFHFHVFHAVFMARSVFFMAFSRFFTPERFSWFHDFRDSRDFRDFRGFRGPERSFFTFTFFTLFPWPIGVFPCPIAHVFTDGIFVVFVYIYIFHSCVKIMKSAKKQWKRGIPFEHETPKADLPDVQVPNPCKSSQDYKTMQYCMDRWNKASAASVLSRHRPWWHHEWKPKNDGWWWIWLAKHQ